MLAPDIPTITEAGYPGYVAVTSFGLYGKAGIPPAIAAEYASIVTEALGTAPVVEALHKMGLVPVGGTPAEFTAQGAGGPLALGAGDQGLGYQDGFLKLCGTDL